MAIIILLYGVSRKAKQVNEGVKVFSNVQNIMLSTDK
jgi:hypothetical protein